MLPSDAAEICVVDFAGTQEANADLVREDLLGRVHLVERLGIESLVQLSEEELIREDGELDQKRARLCSS